LTLQRATLRPASILKMQIRFLNRRVVTALIVGCATVLPAPALQAQFTWDGGSVADDFFATGANWVGDVAPPLDLTGQNLIFGPTMMIDQTPDAFTDNYLQIGSLLFSGADATYDIIGTGFFSFNDDAVIRNDSAMAIGQTLSINLVGNGGSLAIDAMMGDLTIGGTIDLSDSNGVRLTVLGDNNTLLSGVISGVGGSLLKQGDGILTLTGANTYDGGTQFAGGTIILGDDSALGATEGDLVVVGDGGAIQSNVDGRAIANNVNINSAAQLTFSGAFDLDLDGVISGAGGLVVAADVGTSLTLNGANTYAGGTTLTQGTIVLGTDSALGTGVLTVAGDGTIESDDDDRTVGNAVVIDDMMTLTFSGDSDLELSGVISGLGGLAVDTEFGGETLTLSGQNTYEGGTTLTEGTIVLGNDNALGDADMSILTVNGAGGIQSDDDDRVIANEITLDLTGTLTFSGANDLQITGEISGDGALAVNADANVRLILSGENTGLTSDTTLTQGTIVLGSDTALGDAEAVMNVLTVAGDGSIESNNDDRVLANTVVIDDMVTLTFSGANDLRITGAISGDVDSDLVINADDGVRLILSGENTGFMGDTTLTQGILAFGNDDALGDGVLNLAGAMTSIQSNNPAREIGNAINNNGFDLTVIGGDDLALAGVIDGAGGLVKDGSGTLTLKAINTYMGGTEVNSGRLLIAEGALIAGSVNVHDGATFGGDGAMTGDLINLEGGTVSPGSSIGTFTVNGGNYDQQAGSTLFVELSANTGESDLLQIVGGSATLDDDSTIVAAISGDGFLADGQGFTIIDADMGITANGADLETNSATLTIMFNPDSDVSDGTYEILVSRAGDAYAAAADPGNNRAIGSGLDSLVSIAEGDPTGVVGNFLGELDSLDAEEYNTIVKELSPEPFNTLTATSIDTVQAFTAQQATYLASKRSGIAAWTRSLQRGGGVRPGSLASARNDASLLAAALAEMQDADAASKPSRWGSYARLQAVFSDQDTSANRTGFDGESINGQMGIDYRFTQDFMAGLAVGYTFTEADLNEGLGKFDNSTLRAGPYMSLHADEWFVDGSLTFGYHSIDSERRIPTLGLTAVSNYDGYDITAYAGGGYSFEVQNGLHLTPMASVQYSYFEFDGFTESGAGAANLTVGDRHANSLRTRLGASLSYEIDLGPKFVPFVSFGWEHEFFDDDELEASFAAGGSPFKIDTGTREADSFLFGLGVNVLIDHTVTGFIRYEHAAADDGDVDAIAAGVSITF